MVTGTSAVADFDLRGCRSPLSYCRFQRNTWFAFTPLASATLATLAPGSSVSLTILSFSSIRRKTRRFRLDDTLASMRPIVSRHLSHVQMGRPDAYAAETFVRVVPEGRLDIGYVVARPTNNNLFRNSVSKAAIQWGRSGPKKTNVIFIVTQQIFSVP